MLPPALIVAHGQPGNPGPQQAAIEDLATKVGMLLPGREVQGATLAAPGALAAGVRPGALIYPLFMASGWFTRVELPRRLGLEAASDLQILPPFGSDPGLPGLARSLIAQAAAAQGWPLSSLTLLIAAHGSGRSRAPALAAEALGAALAPGLARVQTGFVEEPPFLADAARDLGPRSICLPFFASAAEHVTDDLPEALAEAGFAGLTLPPLGLADEVPGMIADAIRRA